MDKLEEIFEILKQDEKIAVDRIMDWLKESKLIDNTKKDEDRVKKFFSGDDSKDIKLDKFNEVVAKLAKEKKRTLEDAVKMLTDRGPQIIEAVKAGVSAFKDAM